MGLEVANVSFLLTRPHTTVDDRMIEVVPFSGGRYTTPELNLSKPGRYTLQFRARIGSDTGYSQKEAYLPPEKK
jgi:nitrogen fixation protein FixH